jgi:hypothetical protein
MTTEIKTITINGVEYNESDLSADIKNTIVARSEILQSKVRHEIEMEKIEVLLAHYNKKIEEEIKNIKK